MLPGKDAETVMFDFVQPAKTGGRVIHERGFTRANEPRRRALSSSATMATSIGATPGVLESRNVNE
jgi:hypothetical protein